jgi:hypothetical protein
MVLPKALAASQAVSSIDCRPSPLSSGSRIVFMVVALLYLGTGIGLGPRNESAPGANATSFSDISQITSKFMEVAPAFRRHR